MKYFLSQIVMRIEPKFSRIPLGNHRQILGTSVLVNINDNKITRRI